MSLLSYLRANKWTTIFFITILILLNFILLTSINIKKSLHEVLYLNFLILLFAVIYTIFSFLNWKNKYKLLRCTLDKKENIDYKINNTNDFYSVLITDIISNKNIESAENTKKLKTSLEELNDFITKWVHEIKIPISVCELLLENYNGISFSNNIQNELEKIKFLTNQVLYISRASSYSEDLVIKNLNLDNIIKNSLKRHSFLFISKNIEIQIGELDFEVLTDEKWISYVVGQLLHNSFKYLMTDGKLDISAIMDEKKVELIVKDNGIGILKKDLDRIFDRSFTGNNGINIAKSTGMGLYISKKMLSRLGHKIEVKSEPSLFTEFIITFYKISKYI